MANANVAVSKVKQDILELLLPRLPKADHLDLHDTQEQLDAAVAPMRAKFEEIRSRYAPGTMMIIDALGNITTLELSESLLMTILEVAHHEAHGSAEGCIFTV